MFRRQSKLTRLSGEGSEQSLSQGSSRSKSHSLDSSEDLSKSSTLSSPEANSKRAESFSSAKSSVLLSDTSENDFPVKILGCLENVIVSSGGPLDVINLIDVAQQENDLPFVAHNEDSILSLTVHGIKVIKSSNNEVIYRIPLHMIERLVIFDDGLIGNTMLAVKAMALNNDASFLHSQRSTIHVYQCDSKDTAQEVCRTFNHILDTALSSSSPSIMPVEVT